MLYEPLSTFQKPQAFCKAIQMVGFHHFNTNINWLLDGTSQRHRARLDRR